MSIVLLQILTTTPFVLEPRLWCMVYVAALVVGAVVIAVIVPDVLELAFGFFQPLP